MKQHWYTLPGEFTGSKMRRRRSKGDERADDVESACFVLFRYYCGFFLSFALAIFTVACVACCACSVDEETRVL